MSAGTLICLACGSTYQTSEPLTACRCGGLLEHRLPPCPPAEALRQSFDQRLLDANGSGVWRYRELIVQPQGPVVSWPEGNTPLVFDQAMSDWARVERLGLKHEGLNPTGSFKDRGMTVGVTKARELGASMVGCASTGNTAASLSAYAARAGLPAMVILPSGGVAQGKLAQATAYGATIISARTDFDGCLKLLQGAAEELGVYLLNSINPWRLEGQKSLILELLHQRGWDPPDWIVVPAGNLGNTSAFGKALLEAKGSGLVSKIPRIAAVQAEGAAPFEAAYRSGFAQLTPVEARTVASAIRIGNPASYDRAVRAIRDTGGMVIKVSDDEILAAKREIDAKGIGCESASASSVAGVKAMAAAGLISREDDVVAVLTGNLLKEPERISGHAPIEIDATIGELARAMGQAG